MRLARHGAQQRKIVAYADATRPRSVQVSVVIAAALPQAAQEALLATIPMKRLGAPEDVARAVAFFAGAGAGYITGQVLCVDGGMAV